MTLAPYDLAPYDGILLLSFGGPEAPEDILPFLRNVTRGRGIPDERLAVVAGHYHRLGGRSPINDQNRALTKALLAELGRRGLRTPVFWGNRNWHPLLVDTLREAYEAGARRLLTLVTSAYSSYSGCRQYREDLADALIALAAEGRTLEVDKVRPYYNHPGFVEPVCDGVAAGLAELPPGAHLLFVTHALPVAAAVASGPHGGAYEAQHRELAAAVAARVGQPAHGWDLAFCSRSGSARQPWLEPDVNDRLAALHDEGVPGVLVAPIGFVSDHLEVAYDLDVEARATAARLGLPFARATTPGTDPRFVAGLVDLLLERAAVARGEFSPGPVSGTLPPGPDVCPAGCCPNLGGTRPAACGVDWTGAPAGEPVPPEVPVGPGSPVDLTERLVGELQELAESAARQAGELVHGRRPDRLEVGTKSSPTDVVTQMDTAAEELLRGLICAARPQDGLLGEESGLQPGTSGLTWVVDPIDGTVNYLYGMTAYAVSVAVVIGDPTVEGAWSTVAGCVHSPADGGTWTAGLGRGAFLNGRRLQMAEPPALPAALVATGFGYRAARRREQARVLASLLPQIRDIRRVGCAALDLCLLATGRLDAYYERGVNSWDIAAGRLVVTEAGGQVRGLGAAPPSRDMVIAGRRPLVDDLADVLEGLDAARADG